MGNLGFASTSAGPAQQDRGPDGTPARGVGLCAFLAAAADRHPDRPAFLDQPDKAQWCSRPPIAWTYGTAREIVGRLAEALRRLGLPPASPVGLCMAGISEASLAFLAVEEAGHLPCLLPVSWPEDRLGRAVEAAQMPLVITQGLLGEDRPAERFCRIAGGYFGLRFVAAFGPQIPDGVLPLDRAVLDTRAPEGGLGPSPAAGLVTFEVRDGVPRAVHRSAESLVAAIAAHLVVARVAAGERILTTLPASDLRGVVTGLGAALLAGGSLESHPVFSGAALAQALADAVPTHLVMQTWLEEALDNAALPPSLRTLIVAHRAPMRFGGGGRRDAVEVLALGEQAVLTARRGEGGLSGMVARPVGTAVAGLLGLRCNSDGGLDLTGPAAAATPFRSRNPSGPGGTWRPSGYRVDALGDAAAGVFEE